MDISEYIDLGGKNPNVSETLFDRYAFKAVRAINRLTHGRIEGVDSSSLLSVQYLCVELIDLYVANENAAEGASVAAVGNDGVNITYRTSSEAAASVRASEYALAANYLANEVGEDGICLLYAGVM